jgi:hypothetical protein
MALPQTQLQLHLRPQQNVIQFGVLFADELSLQALLLPRLRSAFRPQVLLLFNNHPPLQPCHSRTALTLKSSYSNSSMERTSIDIVSLDQYSSVLKWMTYPNVVMGFT